MGREAFVRGKIVHSTASFLATVAHHRLQAAPEKILNVGCRRH
jgi:hypothetical protein